MRAPAQQRAGVFFARSDQTKLVGRQDSAAGQATARCSPPARIVAQKIVLEVLLAAANVGDEPNDPGVTLGPRLERARPQAALEARGQHGNGCLLDDRPVSCEIELLSESG